MQTVNAQPSRVDTVSERATFFIFSPGPSQKPHFQHKTGWLRFERGFNGSSGITVSQSHPIPTRIVIKIIIKKLEKYRKLPYNFWQIFLKKTLKMRKIFMKKTPLYSLRISHCFWHMNFTHIALFFAY